MDLEAWETALRAAVLAAGAKVLEGFLQGLGCGRQEEKILCECGSPMESRGLKGKDLLTILGPVSYRRSMFQCPRCQRTRYPADELLDVQDTTRSPGLRRMMARAGSQSTFKEGCEDLRLYTGIEVSAKDLERVAEGIGQQMETWNQQERARLLEASGPLRPPAAIPVLYLCADGTGVPMVPEELQGRKGKQADGTARTREAKLGCVFTQTGTDAKGYPVRDADSTSFVGSIESAELFGWRLYAEALRRGLPQARKIVALSDGSEWIKNLIHLHFPEALHIIDLYHAREHVAQLCNHLFASDEKKRTQYRIRWWTALDNGDVETLLLQAQRHLPENPQIRKPVQGELGYLEKNKERMRYADFRAQGLFVGSGVVEAGCKTLIGQRLKRSGMEWSLRGANAILSLRCNIHSGRFEDFWESRAA